MKEATDGRCFCIKRTDITFNGAGVQLPPLPPSSLPESSRDIPSQPPKNTRGTNQQQTSQSPIRSKQVSTFLTVKPAAYRTYLARNADLLVHKELVDVCPLVSGHLHDVSTLRIAHDCAVTAGGVGPGVQHRIIHTHTNHRAQRTGKMNTNNSLKTTGIWGGSMIWA